MVYSADVMYSHMLSTLATRMYPLTEMVVSKAIYSLVGILLSDIFIWLTFPHHVVIQFSAVQAVKTDFSAFFPRTGAYCGSCGYS